MDWLEKCQKRLVGELLNHKASDKFLIFLDEKEPELIEKMLSKWINTKDGLRWYENCLECLIADRPEMEPEDLPGASR